MSERTGNNKQGLCECGEPLDTCDQPDEIFLWTIPFTRIELKIWRWCKVSYCRWCAMDNARTDEEEAYNAGYEDGYSKGERCPN